MIAWRLRDFLFAILTITIITPVASASVGIWKVRDVAAKSDWIAANADGRVPSLKLHLAAKVQPTRASCTVIDDTAGERAVTLAYCIPLDAAGGTWWDDPDTPRTIDGKQIYSNCSNSAGGVNDQASLYPIAVVSKNETATVIACPVDEPRMVRLVYDAGQKELRAEFDFGLSPIVKKDPSRADAAIVTYTVPAKWAFREAIAKYHSMYADAFARRVTSAGIWMPFAEIGGIENAKDFGFAFHEVAEQQLAGSTARDDAKIGCGDYIYVEPQTNWQAYRGTGKGTYDQRLAQLTADANAGDKRSQATLVSGIIRDTGFRDLYMAGVAYTPMLPWGCDPNPAIATTAEGWPGKGQFEFDRIEPLLGWRNKPSAKLAGVYVDSMEGWGEILDYSHEHWRVSEFPLTFDPSTHRVALLNFWGVYSWVREMSRQLHQHGMILFGNDAYFRRWQLCPWVDVPGREYTWIESDKFTPVSDARYLFLRSMSGAKPYLMLMNNHYEHGEFIEKYFQRNLFYAVYPSFYVSHDAADEIWYWSNPAWYNRDRPLFKKYVPMIRRLDQAGWQPVPRAEVSPPTMRIERYGSWERGDLALAIHNPKSAAAAITITLDSPPKHFTVKRWVHDDAITMDAAARTIKLQLAGDAYEVISVEPSGK